MGPPDAPPSLPCSSARCQVHKQPLALCPLPSAATPLPDPGAPTCAREGGVPALVIAHHAGVVAQAQRSDDPRVTCGRYGSAVRPLRPHGDGGGAGVVAALPARGPGGRWAGREDVLSCARWHVFHKSCRHPQRQRHVLHCLSGGQWEAWGWGREHSFCYVPVHKGARQRPGPGDYRTHQGCNLSGVPLVMDTLTLACAAPGACMRRKQHTNVSERAVKWCAGVPEPVLGGAESTRNIQLRYSLVRHGLRGLKGRPLPVCTLSYL